MNRGKKEVSTVPNIKSAEKRVRVTAKQTARNKAIKTNLKTVTKKAEAAIAVSADDSVDAVRFAIKRIDQAVSKGVLHKNTAARKKSALAKKIG